MIGSERGSVLLRILIVILSVGVILSVLIPQLREKRESEDTVLCREQMTALARAQNEHRETSGIYADNLDSLRVFLPEGADFVCPTDGRNYRITAVDSTTYTIGCPNEHGIVITGSNSWEQK